MKSGVTNTIAPGLRKLASRLPKALENAAGVAGLAVIDDAVNEDPTPPLDTGYLRGSWFVYVNGKKKSSGSDAGSLPGTIQTEQGTVSTTIGFSAPYAAAQHQNLEPAGTWQRGPKSPPNSGGNYLGSKLDRNKDRYAKIFADRLAKAIMGGQ